MKKWAVLIATLVAMVIPMTAQGIAFADDGEEGHDGPSVRPPVLLVDAPRYAQPNEEVTITVFRLDNRGPVEDAAVWAIRSSNVEALKADLALLREASAPLSDDDWQALVSTHGTILGTTNGSGEIAHAFDESGGYMLVALKDGHHPGRTGIRIIPPLLVVDAPRSAQPDEEVTISVSKRNGGDSVKDADVWAINSSDAEAFRADLALLREAGTPLSDDDRQSLVSTHGTLLGATNGSGQLKHAFDDPGGYMLVALKEDHRPGRTGIRIIRPVMLVDAPRYAEPGEEITIAVSQRDNSDPVKNAEVWAIGSSEAEAFRADVAVLREAGTPISDDDRQILVSTHGTLLGTTNGSGQLKYAFDDPGGYMLVALKEHHRPGRIGIRVLPESEDSQQ
ncbi:MAG: hypothetical protein O7D33_06240 [Chloroflexi bacterium]|nr:hypothetical protein [Chloroflexota bacterium]